MYAMHCRGLGKTLETISLMLSNQRSTFATDIYTAVGLETRQLLPVKTTLVVSPSSILEQWLSEIDRHAPVASGGLSYGVYSGIKSQMTAEDLGKYDVVLTSYETLTAEGMWHHKPVIVNC
jgi:E3 ubiquitin-protein ligase SHPRH